MKDMQTYTVTIAGSERYDGEAPYDYVVYAGDEDHAKSIVLAAHFEDTEDDDIVVLDVKPGLPEPNWNDLRPKPPLMSFEDAQELHRLRPDTFEAPTEAELAGIIPGEYVKVCIGDERFWVVVTEAAGDRLTGIVSNDLNHTDVHGLRRDDTVMFSRSCVYTLWSACCCRCGRSLAAHPCA